MWHKVDGLIDFFKCLVQYQGASVVCVITAWLVDATYSWLYYNYLQLMGRFFYRVWVRIWPPTRYNDVEDDMKHADLIHCDLGILMNCQEINQDVTWAY